MTTTSADIQAKIDKLAINMDRLDQITNGGPTVDVTVDSGTVPSIAKFFAATNSDGSSIYATHAQGSKADTALQPSTSINILSAHFVDKPTALTEQGGYLLWNVTTTGEGETSFVNNQGLGTPGGFAWSSFDSITTPIMRLVPSNGGRLIINKAGWLEPIVGGTETDFPVIQALSSTGQAGGLFATQSADSPLYCANPGFCMGANAIVSIALNNSAPGFRQSVDGAYIESRRYAGAGPTQCSEMDILNFGTVIDLDPYIHVPFDTLEGGHSLPSGFTTALAISAGRQDVTGGNNAVSAALTIGNNGAFFRKGIIFLSDAIQSDGGHLRAINFGQSHELSWFAGTNGSYGTAVAFIRSDATAVSQSLTFANGGLYVQSLTGTNIAIFGTNGGLTLPSLPATAPTGTTAGYVRIDSSGNLYKSTT